MLILHAPKPGQFTKREAEAERLLKATSASYQCPYRFKTVYKRNSETGYYKNYSIVEYMYHERLDVMIIAGSEVSHRIENIMHEVGSAGHPIWNFADPCSALDNLWHDMAEKGYI